MNIQTERLPADQTVVDTDQTRFAQRYGSETGLAVDGPRRLNYRLPGHCGLGSVAG